VSPGPDAPAVPRVLTVAGSDCCGGAGIQADIKTITCLGGFAMSAVAALTAQDTRGVWGVHPVPPEFVARQVRACLEDIGADAAKTGMLCNAGIVRAVAEAFRQRPVPNLVVDPVMFSKSGHALLDDAGRAALREELLPLAAVVTPNLEEAAFLAERGISAPPDMRRAAEAILRLGVRAVVVKGGHLEGDALDILYDGERFVELRAPRLGGRVPHGTGCAFSAALATCLGQGLSLEEAARRAKRFVTEAIRAGFDFGGGYGLLNPLTGAAAADSAG